MRSSRKAVTFLHPFNFTGLDEAQPAGTYIVVTEEEQIPGVLFEGWRRTETSLRLPALGRDTGIEQVVVINPQDLAEALANDIANSN